MSAEDIRMSIYQILEKTDNTLVLEAYHEILKNIVKIEKAQIVGFDSNNEPINLEQLQTDVTTAGQRIEAGQFISQEDLKNNMKNW